MKSKKSRGIAILLAIFLGGLGIHRFYLDKPTTGVMYLIFSWSGIPMVISLGEAMWMLMIGQKGFDRAYNGA